MLKTILFQIIAGFENIYLPTPFVQVRRILKTFPAPVNNNVVDLTIIRLDTPFALNPKVRTIQLARQGYDPPGTFINFIYFIAIDKKSCRCTV